MTTGRQSDSAAHNHTIFRKLADRTAHLAGTPWAFGVALATIVVWGLTGPVFHFSDTWQLVVNTGTTILTFLMVFLIQNTQNRDATAIHLKLDELIMATHQARNGLIAAETLSDEQLRTLQAEFVTALADAQSRTAEEAADKAVSKAARASLATPALTPPAGEHS